MSVNSATFTSGEATPNGGMRNARQFWRQWSEAYPETLSEANFARVQLRLSPLVDQHWANHFPEHANFLDEILVHHHLDYGPKAIPLPGSVHSKQPGWGIWHPDHAGK
jgi:filamentous hemagglutinin